MRVLLTLLILVSTTNLAFADGHGFDNKDIFAPWNEPLQKDDIFAPWNDPLQKDDIFAPWNDPIAGQNETNQYMRDNDVDDSNYYWD